MSGPSFYTCGYCGKLARNLCDCYRERERKEKTKRKEELKWREFDSIRQSIHGRNVKSDENKEECYVATLCYGGKDANEVLKLRKYRDDVLNKKLSGRIFIYVYYKISPHLVKRLKNRNKLNQFIKVQILDKIVKSVTKE